MKLSCSVAVAAYESRDSGVGVAGARRALKSTLALARDGDAECCLLLFDSINKHGKKYKMGGGNVTRVFDKFRREGKATIRFREPPHDLLVHGGDPLLLGAFLKTLRECLEGRAQKLPAHGACVAPKESRRAPTKLCITDRAQLPAKGFPRTLESLRMSGLGMCTLRRDVFNLHNLSSLSLEENSIEKIPEEIGSLVNLRTLMLQNNKLGMSKYSDWKWINRLALSNKLKCLDLSYNELNFIPDTICKLKNIEILNLSSNKLKNLPNGIGTMKLLRFFMAANNNLISLPASMLCLHLTGLDIGANPLEPYRTVAENNPIFRVSTLVDIAAMVILKKGIYYDSHVVPFTLVDYMDSAKYCKCGSPALDYITYIKRIYSLKLISETLVTDGESFLNFDCYVCSYPCYRKYFSRKRHRQ